MQINLARVTYLHRKKTNTFTEYAIIGIILHETIIQKAVKTQYK